MNWFEQLTGFAETDYHSTQSQLEMEGDTLICLPNGQRYQAGRLLTPTLGQLRQQTAALPVMSAPNRLSEWVGDVRDLHQDPVNKNALFQVASQFNLLEMVSPQVTPLEGISDYAYDKTQGPVCAMACAAGTLYRNYLVPIQNQQGQTDQRQLNMLDAFEAAIHNEQHQYWQMQNGYVMPTQPGLVAFHHYLRGLNSTEREQLKATIKVGLQQNTQVTLGKADHCVSQVYCSALPVAYSNYSEERWQPFAQLVLEAAYEATFHHALLEQQRTGNKRVYLTLLGAGAFGNPVSWITQAIENTLARFNQANLDLVFVSYGQSSRAIQQLIQTHKGDIDHV